MARRRRRPEDDYAEADDALEPTRRAQLPRQAFGYGHAFWPKAVQMAQKGALPGQILDEARRSGFSALTYTQIKVGLGRAPADLNIPSPVAGFMRRRYERLLSDFNAIEKAKQTVIEAELALGEIIDELQNLTFDDESIFVRDRVAVLEQQRQEWWQKWHTATRQIIELDLKLNPPKLPEEGDGDRTTIDVIDPEPDEQLSIEARLDAKIAEFAANLPEPPIEMLIATFGADRIRPPRELPAPDDDIEPADGVTDGDEVPEIQLTLPIDV